MYHHPPNGSFVASQKLSILDYVLQDPAERARLKIANTPVVFECSTIRAPVPWHMSGAAASAFLEKELFDTNPIMLQLRELWDLECSYRRFV